MLRLKCLGGLTLESDDVVIPASALQRRRLALLLLLSRARKNGLTRDRLMALLWPEAATASARHALDQLLYATRRDLGKEIVLCEGPQLRLNDELIGSDVAEFEELLSERRLETAVTLYGGLFIDGVYLSDSPEFEQWIDAQRAELHDEFLNALEALASQATDAKAAVHLWKQRMSAEPFSARGALALMRAYADAGERTAAIRYGESYCELVRTELGADPDVEIAEYMSLLAAQPEPTLVERIIPPALRTNRVVWPVAAAVVFLIVLGANEMSQSSSRTHVANEETKQLYMRGRIAWNTRSREGLERAVVLFRKATEHDPLYAEAYAGLAESYALLGYHGFMPMDAAFPKAIAAAKQGLALDPKLGAAHTALGLSYQWHGRWADAENELKQAIEFAPEYATAHQHYALLLKTLRRDSEALSHARRAAELDPLSTQINNTYAIILSGNGQVDSALKVYDRIVTKEPDSAWVRQNPWVLSNFGSIAARNGQYDLAERMIELSLGVVPQHPRLLDALANLHIAQGDTASALEAIAAMDTTHPLYPAYRAFMYARLGDVDSAFVWFDRVTDWSPMTLMKLNSVERAAPLYSDPRYTALRKRFRLPD